MSWRVEGDESPAPVRVETDVEHGMHTVLDRSGNEWMVYEVETPQGWARRDRCLVLNSRECVRRVWEYPSHWQSLDTEALLRLGVRD